MITNRGLKKLRIFRRLICRKSLFAVALIIVNASAARVLAYASGAPTPFNQTIISAKVLEARSVDSTTLKILPPQPIVVLRLELLAVKQTSEGSFLSAKPGDVISVYSKEPSAAAYAGKEVVAIITFRGDEHGGSFWAQEISFPGAR